MSTFRLLGIGVLLLSASLLRPPPVCAQDVTVSGYVEDAASGEKLPGAAVYAPDREAGTTTNRYGFFSLTLPAGRRRVAFRYVGYRPRLDTLRLQRDTMLTVALAPATLESEEVVVEAERSERIEETTRMSTAEVPVEQIESLPALAGEVDVLKALQLLPGVKGGQEATSGLYVRGGGPSQNLILLDGVPVYNASHLFGFLSVFNSDAIQSVELTKGGFPARYGGRLSSVVEIGMKEGNQKAYAAQGSVGLLSSRLTVEGPLVEDRTSFMVSGRRTYADLVVKPLLSDEEADPTAYFYDLNAKINHAFSPQDRVFLSLYTGEDRFGADFEEEDSKASARLYWGNVTAALRWNHLFSDKLFANTTLTFSDYDFNVSQEERITDPGLPEATAALRYRSGVRDWGAKIDFDYLPAPRHYVRFGAGATLHDFNPGALSQVDVDPFSALDTTFATSQTRALEISAYAEDDVRLTPRLKVNAGVHTSAFRLPEETYASLQPRLSARYRLSDRWALKASGAAMRQYIHLLSNAGVGLPTDLWVPATERVAPQQAWQTAAGLAGTLSSLPLLGGDGNGRYEVSLEGYYKDMSGLIAYEPGAVFASPLGDWQDRVVTGGEGASYGAEFFVQKKTGRTTGWLGYTLSWTDRRFDALNGGERFPYRYDRRHDLSLVLSHRISAHLDLSATAVYSTGNAITLPSAQYVEARKRLGGPPGTINYYDERNGFRMPAYHRLDLGARFYFSRRPNEHVLALSVYNAYNHKNPFFLDLSTTGEGDRKLTGYAIFPVLPSVSYRFAF